MPHTLFPFRADQPAIARDPRDTPRLERAERRLARHKRQGTPIHYPPATLSLARSKEAL
jgi:hypothetical protein